MDDELLEKARSKKKKAVLTAAVLIVLAVAVFWGFKVLGPGAGLDHTGNGNKDGTVTVTIECKELAANMDMLTKPELKKYIPEDGVILDKEEYNFKKDESVYDALEHVCMESKIQLESSEDAVYQSRYIEGINYLYEKDAGKKSGWLYSVNGKQPNYGASKIKLKNKDEIVWSYTVDYEHSEDD